MKDRELRWEDDGGGKYAMYDKWKICILTGAPDIHGQPNHSWVASSSDELFAEGKAWTLEGDCVIDVIEWIDGGCEATA